MAHFSTFLGLPPELRNSIYESAALDEQIFRVKKTLHPQGGHIFATQCGLLLANRQISKEYGSVVQEVALWPETKVDFAVYDFNFKRFEKFLFRLPLSQATELCQNGRLQIRLVMSTLRNYDIGNLMCKPPWGDERPVDVRYYVDDAKSGYSYPMAPPRYDDIMPFRRMALDSIEYEKITAALEDWQDRCQRRRYRLLVATGASTTTVCLKWEGDLGEFIQFSPKGEDDDPEACWWTWQVHNGIGSDFKRMIAWQEKLDARESEASTDVT